MTKNDFLQFCDAHVHVLLCLMHISIFNSLLWHANVVRLSWPRHIGKRKVRFSLPKVPRLPLGQTAPQDPYSGDFTNQQMRVPIVL